MRAWELDGGLRLAERDEPRPGPGEVLVAIRAAALNYRDLIVHDLHQAPHRVPASDGAGEVLDVGPGVDGLAPGDRVVGAFFPHWVAGPPRRAQLAGALGGEADGVLAERVAFAADGLVRIPAELGFEEAATFPCAAVTAWNALHGCAYPVTEADVVLCLGSGGVSVFALQIANLAGARTIATSSSPDKLDRLRAVGADDVVNYVRAPAWDAAVREFTGGRGADFVIDVGGAETLERSLRACARGGVVTMIGVLTGRATSADGAIVYANELTLRGVYVGPRMMLERSLRAFAEAGERPVIDRIYAFEDVPAAYERLRSGEHIGKVVIGF